MNIFVSDNYSKEWTCRLKNEEIKIVIESYIRGKRILSINRGKSYNNDISYSNSRFTYLA